MRDMLGKQNIKIRSLHWTNPVAQIRRFDKKDMERRGGTCKRGLKAGCRHVGKGKRTLRRSCRHVGKEEKRFEQGCRCVGKGLFKEKSTCRQVGKR